MAIGDKIYIADKPTLDEVKSNIGATADTGGTTAAGGIFAKLNAILQQFFSNWTAVRAAKLDGIGSADDTGGTATTGTVMGKLNALFGGGAIKSIQRGVVLFPSNADVRITISTINPQKTFVLLDNSVLAMGTQNVGFTYGSILVELASTSFVLKPNYGHISTSDRLDYTVGYQIVEFY